MGRGIAFKYQGPFKVAGVDPNGCNYTIRKEGPRHKRKRVHKNNLKAFFCKAAQLTPSLNVLVTEPMIVEPVQSKTKIA